MTRVTNIMIASSINRINYMTPITTAIHLLDLAVSTLFVTTASAERLSGTILGVTC